VFWLQASSLALAILVPIAIWAAHRRRPHPALERGFAFILAGLLLFLEAAGLWQKYVDGQFTPDLALPMQLCDWTLFAVAAALLTRHQTCFEVSYFWGLCGTIQALFTPAIRADTPFTRQLVFFLGHAAIVAGVLFLLLVPKLRPRAFLPIFIWSEIYLLAALAVNTLTGGNYGFLAHRPPQASMLDLFSDTHWLYVAQINAVGLGFFFIAYLPWLLVRRTN
jgi:hypothetical integral membrane protein (TIGR02206 family)